jgi:transglutaminase-like putative cysteine protease
VQAINPLDQLALWASQPAKPVMTVQSSYPGPWRLAVLPTWDSVDGWTTSDASTFYRIGTDVPGPTLAPAQIAPGDAAASQEVHIQDLPGPWLPAAQRPITVTGVAALAQPSTGELLATSGRADGAQYGIVSSVPTATPNAAGDGPGSYPLIADIPPAVQALAVQLTQGAVTPWAKASALVNALGGKGGKYQFLATAPSGTDTQVLQNFLVGTGSSAHQGTSEQFAGGFALLAEALNLPTRVVVEFHSGTEVNGVWHVTTKDAFAAAEVEFANVGWVLFDPTPRPDSAPAPKDETVKGSSTISTSTPPVPAGKHYTQGTPPPVKAASGSSALVHGLAVAGVVVGSLLVVLGVIALLVSGTRKRRTRKRRNSEAARDRVMGAWIESLELVRDLGPPSPNSDTASELAAVGAQRLGVSEAIDFQPLATMANATLFSTWEPDDDAALDAWKHTDRVAEQIGDRLGAKGRFFRAFDIRVLFRR